MKTTTDLSGVWEFSFDRNAGYRDTILLPDTISHAQKGKASDQADDGRLTDLFSYEGSAWFRRKAALSCPDGGRLELFLERTRKTALFVDGSPAGECCSLCCAHRFDLTSFCDGNVHELEICVSNTGYPTAGGHMTSPDTQTNWLGITGKIELRQYGPVRAEQVRVRSDVKNRCFLVEFTVSGNPADCRSAWETGAILVSASCKDAVFPSRPLTVFGDRALAVIPLGDDPHFWSEFDPCLYDVSIDVDGDRTKLRAGFREFSTDGGKFLVSGRRTFLRGKHDGMLFPRTGYAPTDVKSWLVVMSAAKEYGVNHYRFHTCCPPEAAFDAADMLGIYLEPELPFWGTIAAPGEEGYRAAEQDFLISEGLGILDSFGNHPSFCMMSMGNELWGSPMRINEIMGILKAHDDRPLYTQGSNNFQFRPCTVPNDDFFVGVRLSKYRLLRGSYATCDAPLGHIQTDAPGTLTDYDGAILADDSAAEAETGDSITIQYHTGTKEVKVSEQSGSFHPNIPIVTHEIGQFCVYPDFREIAKYTGSLKPRNLEIFRERLQKKGLLHLADAYFRASGALAVQCYKEELEAVLRSRRLAGCQILDLQDFAGQGTALVGILDAFMESKGLIAPKEWREFFAPCVLLARFFGYVYTPGEAFSADIQLTDFGTAIHTGETLFWELGKQRGSLVIPDYENYADIGKIETRIDADAAPGRLRLRLWTDSGLQNHYDLDVIKAVKEPDSAGCCVRPSLDAEAASALREGRKVLIFERPDESSGIDGFYCTDFWNYPMFRGISEAKGSPVAVGTLGLLIDQAHPALAGFPGEAYSTPRWYHPVTCSRSAILDDVPDKRVIVRTIDNFERNHDLALIYERDLFGGTAVFCGCELSELVRTPEGRALAASLMDYVRV